MNDQLLEHAIDLIRSGDREQGGQILVGLLKENKEIERAWAWLYACVKTDEQRIFCLNKVLVINPNNVRAKAALEKLIEKPISQQAQVQQSIPNRQAEKENRSESQANEQDAESDSNNVRKVTEPHVFNPKIYNLIIIKHGENQFAKADRMHLPLPEIDTMMIGRRLMIGGISITVHEHPKCIEIGHIPHKSQCYFCEFFSAADCPIRRNPTILSEVQFFFSQYQRSSQEYLQQRKTAIDAIYSELRIHGRPLHYELVTEMIRDRYPQLHLNSNMILRIMGWHTEKFEWVDTGVYRAK